MYCQKCTGFIQLKGMWSSSTSETGCDPSNTTLVLHSQDTTPPSAINVVNCWHLQRCEKTTTYLKDCSVIIYRGVAEGVLGADLVQAKTYMPVIYKGVRGNYPCYDCLVFITGVCVWGGGYWLAGRGHLA